MNFPDIAVASASPRRHELLNQIGVSFSVVSVDVDESLIEGEAPNDYVQRLAVAKAQAGWHRLSSQQQCPVLGADTAVIIDDKILGKPRDADDARAMLQRLSGRCHQVMTAVALVDQQQVLSKLNISKVCFSELSCQQIDWYISTGEGTDKAGGYAVQGVAAMFIDHIEGSYSGIMGLPLRETCMMLQQLTGQHR
ncbi:MAG: septum formation inhibitor Maf [Gammaproteobacteria bacterium]|nr:septum formation inhibitor Maf [Gammaproteobacteria bacterium]